MSEGLVIAGVALYLVTANSMVAAHVAQQSQALAYCLVNLGPIALGLAIAGIVAIAPTVEKGMTAAANQCHKKYPTAYKAMGYAGNALGATLATGTIIAAVNFLPYSWFMMFGGSAQTQLITYIVINISLIVATAEAFAMKSILDNQENKQANNQEAQTTKDAHEVTATTVATDPSQ